MADAIDRSIDDRAVYGWLARHQVEEGRLKSTWIFRHSGSMKAGTAGGTRYAARLVARCSGRVGSGVPRRPDGVVLLNTCCRADVGVVLGRANPRW
nr:hypothetical protein [Streptomyces sp. TLI_235]